VFKGQPGIEVRQIRKVLRPRNWGRSAEAEAYKKGRKWLKLRKADLLIWGEVVDFGKAISLGFITDNDTINFRDDAPFYLEGNVLDGRFGEIASAQLTAMALSAMKPIHDLEQRQFLSTLGPVVTRLQSLIVEYPDLTTKQRRDLTIARGEALRVLADETGNLGLRDEAISTFRDSLPEVDRATEPSLWAKTHANLGSALARRGEANLDLNDVEQAVSAFRQALEERTEGESPLLWASTQNNLGNARYIRARLTPGPHFFSEAIDAYEAALRVRTREKFPVHWAFISDNRANALLHLGEAERSAERIRGAIDLYEQALAISRQTSTNWLSAMIENNLGAAFVALDNIEPRQIYLDNAISHFHQVLMEWNRQDRPLRWAMLQNNIGEVYRNLGERGEGIEQLERAVEAYELALEEAAPGRGKEIWAKAQRGLANAFVAIAVTELPVGRSLRSNNARRNDTQNTDWRGAQQELQCRINQQRGVERLEAAIKLFESCLEELAREQDPELWTSIQFDLGSACIWLGEQEEGIGLFNKALAAVNEGIRQWSREKAPGLWAVARVTEGRALMRLGDRERDPKRIYDAIDAFRAALEVRKIEGQSLECAHLKNNIGAALLHLGEPASANELDQAIESFQAALAVFQTTGNQIWIAAAEGNLNTALVRKESRSGNPSG
jgi:tetratricopeptide (TPR) repeat protein